MFVARSSVAIIAILSTTAGAQPSRIHTPERTDEPSAEPGGEDGDILVIGRSSPVSVVERAERFQARQVRDIFDADPSIDIGGGSRNGQRLFLRGVEGSNLNITIDGARQGQNLYNHRGGLSNIDPEMLKRVEIQPGPSAADQGYGALGGAIRFETVDAHDAVRAGRPVGGFVRGGYASATEAFRVAAGGYGLLTDEVGLLAYASNTNFEDIRIGGGDRIPFSGGEDRSLLVKLSLVDLGAHSLRVGHEHNTATGLNYQQRGDYPWQLQPSDPRTRPPQDQSLIRDTSTARYRFDPSSPLVDLRVDAYRSGNVFFAPNANAERFVSDVIGGDVRNIFTVPMGGARRLETTVGADYVRDDGTATRTGASTFRNRNENVGLFLQNRLFLGLASLYAGARRDDFSSDYGPRTARGEAWSLNVGGEVTPVAPLTLFAGYGEAARGSGTLPIQFARNVAQALRFNGSATGSLAPERSRQLEGGARLAFADVGGSGITMGGDVTLFRTRIEDAVLYRQPGSGGLGGRPITDVYNFDRTIRFNGVEAGVQLGGAAWASSLRYSDVDIADLPADPQFIARIGAPRGSQIVWDSRATPVEGLSLGYTLRTTGRLTDVPAGQIVYISKPGFTIHDVQAVWEPEMLDGLALELTVTNIGDRRYLAHSTLTQNGFATQEPGRDVRLALRYRY